MLNTTAAKCAVLLAVIITGVLVPLTTSGNAAGVASVAVVFVVTFGIVLLVLRRIASSSR